MLLSIMNTLFRIASIIKIYNKFDNDPLHACMHGLSPKMKSDSESETLLPDKISAWQFQILSINKQWYIGSYF